MPRLSLIAGSCLDFTEAEEKQLAARLQGLLGAAFLEKRSSHHHTLTKKRGHAGTHLFELYLEGLKTLSFLRHSPLFRDL